MSKTFAETFSFLPVSHEHVKPSDVSTISAAAAADAIMGKATAPLRGQALTRALVECAYGTPLVKSLITANKRSSSARLLAQCWPVMPVCNNGKKAPRLLSALELSESLVAMQQKYDALVRDLDEKKAAHKDTAQPVDNGAPAPVTTAEVVEAAQTVEQSKHEEDLIALLRECLAVRALPKELKERIAAVI